LRPAIAFRRARASCSGIAPASGRGDSRPRRAESDAGGHRLLDQCVDVGDADGRAHARDLAGIGAEVAVDEGVALLEAGERGGKQGVGHGQAWAISAS